MKGVSSLIHLTHLHPAEVPFFRNFFVEVAHSSPCNDRVSNELVPDIPGDVEEVLRIDRADGFRELMRDVRDARGVGEGVK